MWLGGINGQNRACALGGGWGGGSALHSSVCLCIKLHRVAVAGEGLGLSLQARLCVCLCLHSVRFSVFDVWVCVCVRVGCL